MHLLRCLQVAIYKIAKEKCKGTILYYNKDTKHSGKEQCLWRSFEKLKEWVLVGGDDVFQGENDLRVEGCVELLP